MPNTVVENARPFALLSSIEIIADWMDALHGTSDLQKVLEKIVLLVKADAALLVRSSLTTEHIRIVEQFDVCAGKVLPENLRSHLKDIVGENSFTTKPGSIWRLSEAADYMSCSNQSVSTTVTSVAESLIITLSTEPTHADFLELQFRSQPLQHDLQLVSMLTGTLVTCWRRRSPGLAEKKLARSRLRAVSNALGKSPAPLLGVSNPANLSRCEFRVCSMLQDGMTVTSIAEALSLSKATIRCHLSSIFSKTGTSCQVELLGLLHALSQNANQSQFSA